MKQLILTLLCLGAVCQGSCQITWHEITSNTITKLNTIDFSDKRIGYIGGNDSLLLKSTDAGRTWAALNHTGMEYSVNGNITHIEFIDDTFGYAVVDNILNFTTDGGLHWARVNDVYLCFVKTTYFEDQLNGVAAGSDCFAGETIQYMVNGNWSFSQQIGTFDPNHDIKGIDFLDHSFGLAVGNSPYIFKTTDGGANWDTISGNFGPSDFTDVHIVNDTLAYASQNILANTNMYVSEDGGNSWSVDWNSFTFYYPAYHSIIETSEKTVFAGGRPSFDSTLGYITMHLYDNFWYFTLLDHEIMDMDTYGDSVVFAVGDSGYIITNVDPVIIGVKDQSIKSDVKVFPNPVRNIVNIENNTLQPLSLNVTDIQGRVLKKQRMTGNKIQLDLSDLSPGAYLLRMRQQGNETVEKIIKSSN